MIYVFYEKLPLYDVSNHKQMTTNNFHHACSTGLEHLYRTTPGSEIHIYDPPLPTSILQFKSEKGKHKTQKPTSLMRWILKYYTREGDVVLDATMGSGSMGVACKEMNRKFIGIEMDEEIYETACQRLEYQTAISE